jgi:hypothetical protein
MKNESEKEARKDPNFFKEGCFVKEENYSFSKKVY